MVRTSSAYVVILLKGHYDESGVILYLKKKKMSLVMGSCSSPRNGICTCTCFAVLDVSDPTACWGGARRLGRS